VPGIENTGFSEIIAVYETNEVSKKHLKVSFGALGEKICERWQALPALW